MKPMIIINFKTYDSGTGEKGKKIVDECEKLSKDSIIIAAQTADLYRLSGNGIRIFSQHIDPVEQGKNTGFITAESVKAAGACGTLLNHAEHKITIESICKAVAKAKENNLKTIVCAATTKEAEDIAKACNPDFIAIEPPELIGGNISVSTANPQIITGTVEAVHRIKKIPIICGAGVCSGDDVRNAIRLGASGVLVANFVMGASDKTKAIKELISGLN